MNTSPTVSIGMPVRNGLPYLRESIDSLLAQTFGDFELIISDNASDDGTVEMCAEYARRDSRIRLLRNSENVGAAENYNRVFREARGRYFKWAAADDVCLPRFLETCIEVLENRSDVVLCYSQAKKFGDRVSGHRKCPDHREFSHPSATRRFRRVMRGAPWARMIFGVIRTDVLRQTNLIGRYPSSDCVLLAELALLGKLHEVADVLFLLRIHSCQSVEAYKSKRDLALWFDPRKPLGRRFPEWRVVAEYAKAIRRSTLPVHIRLRCLLQLRHWLRLRRRHVLGEIAHGCLLTAKLLTRLLFSEEGQSARCGERVAAQ